MSGLDRTGVPATSEQAGGGHAVTGWDVLLQVCGALGVGLVLLDVFLTVLFPASRHGPIRKPLSRWTWRLFAMVGVRLPDARRRDFLAYSGPAQISVTIVAWVVLLAAAWAMVFQPALGSGVVASKGPTDTGWGTAFYVSGFALTTLGTGDVVPVSALYRTLMIVEAATGFSVFTMIVTYFLSIYGAITARKSSASSLHHHTYDTGTSSQLLLGLSRTGDLRHGSGELRQLAHFLTHTAETHTSYPVLRYFHFREERYALPRLLLLALDTVALLRSALDDRCYETLLRSPVVFELHAASIELLDELVPGAPEKQAPEGLRLEWAERFRDTVDVLRDGGLDVVPDTRAGSEEYVALRDSWDARVRALAAVMAYDWDRVEPVAGS